MSRPSGVVSFLFTDVEDSTRLWELDRARMAQSLAVHDTICREEVDRHGGYVFSTAGDAFAVAFHTPDGAIAAALAIQQQLTAVDWPGPALRVRIGIHTGTADEREGDYYGPTLNRTARIMSLGRGGHILLSGTVASMADLAVLQAGLEDHGLQHLAGISAPERVYALTHPSLPVVDGGLRGDPSERTNLVPALTSFIGRESEVAGIAERLAESRLVVLTGPGGSGKTRLATEVGLAMVDSGTAVWLVELSSVIDPTMVMTAIGESFGLRPGPGVTIDEVVTRHLAPRHLLVVVDNCEHVLGGVSHAIQQILRQAPDIRVLATSRESLGIAGETVVPVAPLAVPQADGDADSVRLFRDRARAVLGSFEPTAEDRSAISRICRHLDGIPLGIELAAARLRSLSCEELAERLTGSLGVLTSKSTTGRHRTLEATIAWSYDMLNPDEQRLFRRLSVFVSGFDLDAATAMFDRGDALDIVESLVDKSLLQPIRGRYGLRFRMLEPVRQFAFDLLREAGEDASALHDHAGYFVGWVGVASPHTRGRDQDEWYERIDLVYDDIRAVFRHLEDTHRGDEYLRLGFDLFQYWVQSGLHLEAIETLVRMLDADHGDVVCRIRARFVAAMLGAEITDPVGIEHARRGLELARSAGHESLVGRMELALGAAIRHATDDPEYLEHLHRARHILDDGLDPHWWEPTWDRAYANLILSGYLPQDDPRIAEHGEAAFTAFERLGDRSNVGATLVETAFGAGVGHAVGRLRQATAVFEHARGRYWQAHARMLLGLALRLEDTTEEAAIHLELAAEQLDDLGDLSCWANSTRWLAICEARMGMCDEPRRRMRDVIERFDRLPMQSVVLPRTLDALAEILAGCGRVEEAAMVLGRAETLVIDIETIVPRDLAVIVEQVEAALGPTRAAELRAVGARRDARGLLTEATGWLDA